MSQDFLVSRYYAAEPTCGRVTDDEPVALRITHVSPVAITSVTVTSATGIVLIDADGTTTIVFATQTTLGEVADTINGTANWECKVLDALRADASDNICLPNSAVTATVVNGETVYDVLVDVSVAVYYTYRCTFNRNVHDEKPNGNHRINLTRFTYNVNVGTAASDQVQIYKYDKENNNETQIWQALSVDGAGSGANDTTHTFANGMSGGDNNDLIVRITDAATITDNGANFLQCEYTRE